MYSQVISTIYDVVELRQTDHCCNTLDMLGRHPEIARHVRKLVLRPKDTLARFTTFKGAIVDARLVADAVKGVAPQLDALHSFIWAGEECPVQDDMWHALKIQ